MSVLGRGRYEQDAGNPSTAWYGAAADDDLWQLSYDDLELPGKLTSWALFLVCVYVCA